MRVRTLIALPLLILWIFSYFLSLLLLLLAGIVDGDLVEISQKAYGRDKPNATLSNLEGDLGSSHMQGTPKAQGHEADNLSAESAGKE